MNRVLSRIVRLKIKNQLISFYLIFYFFYSVLSVFSVSPYFRQLRQGFLGERQGQPDAARPEGMLRSPAFKLTISARSAIQIV